MWKGSIQNVRLVHTLSGKGMGPAKELLHQMDRKIFRFLLSGYSFVFVSLDNKKMTDEKWNNNDVLFTKYDDH